MKESEIRLLLAFDEETRPSEQLEELAGMTLSKLKIPRQRLSTGSFNFEVDLFSLLIDARTGISQPMIETWQEYAERQFPRLALVQGLEFAESDFDDIVLIGNRVLEQLATPFLVLHDDLGQPIGLISLEDNLVHDYSGSEVKRYSADSDLVEMIVDFQQEYLQLYSDLGEDGFSQGIFAIALPIGLEKSIGIAELNSILTALAKR